MKRMSLICAVLAALLIGQCVTPALAAGEGTVLYEQTATASAYESGLKWPANTTVSTGTVSANTIRNTLRHSVSSEISSFVPACRRTLLRHSIAMPIGHSRTLMIIESMM